MLLHHCSNFRAWTSISSNSWNAQRQGGLSSDSNSSQPSWLHPSDPGTWSPSLSGPDGISSPAHDSLNPCSQETGPYVKIGSASWRSCCSLGFWKQSACCWQVLHSFWPYCCQESSSLPEQMPVGDKAEGHRQRARLCCHLISDSIFWLFYFTPMLASQCNALPKKVPKELNKRKDSNR